MADVVSLARMRKAAAKKADRQQADANAVKFGRSKAERALEQARADKAKRDLDATQRE